jgi:SAM-dependent methyltransferase
MAASQPGITVLDAGCGLGLLSLWALDAGASSAVAIDVSDLEVAEALAAANGFSDRICFVKADLWNLDLPKSRNAFNLILAMIYLNDPRRDELQTKLAYSLRDRYLAPDGTMIPDRVRYTVRACDWPTQDYFSRRTGILERIGDLEGRYGLTFGPLADAIEDGCWNEHFPLKRPDGRLALNGAKFLSTPNTFVDIDYMGEPASYPDEFDITIACPGTFNTLTWTQELWYKEQLLFANESLSWVENATSVASTDTCTVGLGSKWRDCNVALIVRCSKG